MFPALFMASIKPFCALRPRPDLAGRVCELPYDVLSSEEAREIAAGNPLSFLHVSKPEIDLPAGVNPSDDRVYAKGKENLGRLISDGTLRLDRKPCFYLYRQIMGQHSQTGIVAAASCDDYLEGVIKKHELTRPDKEDDRMRHIETLNSQTGPVFLAYRSREALDSLIAQQSSGPPEVDFTSADGVRHSAWVVGAPADVERISSEFGRLPALYICDGHHRSAAAARVFRARQAGGASGGFLSVIFPHNQLKILPYNRVLKDLNGMSANQLTERLEPVFTVGEGGNGHPTSKNEVAFYLEGAWRTLRFRAELTRSSDAIERLDVTLLQRHVLEPLFGIENPRTNQRIQFVGGIRGPGELERLVDAGEFACAFSMFPTSLEDLMNVADAGGIMPPKSTWFEPKLRDGLFCHMI